MRWRWRNVLDDLRALSWRLPWVRPPQQIGTYVRYVGDVNSPAILNGLVRRLKRSAALGGVRLDQVEAVAHLPAPLSLEHPDPLSAIGSIGVKARVVRV